MPHLKLKLVSGAVADQKTSCSFTEFGGSIGRAEDCDWTLLDLDRFVSKKHLLISFKNSQFVLTDVSSNGVIINNAAEPLGRDNEYTLQPSDNITVGQFAIQVDELNTQAEAPSPISSAPNDNDLLGLVMGPTETNAEPVADDFFNPLASAEATPPPTNEQGLGLNELISGLPSTPESHNKVPTSNPTASFDEQANEQSPFITDALNPPSDSNPIVSDGLIPDDWELTDIAPPTEDYKSFGKPLEPIQPEQPNLASPDPAPLAQDPFKPETPVGFSTPLTQASEETVPSTEIPSTFNQAPIEPIAAPISVPVAEPAPNVVKAEPTTVPQSSPSPQYSGDEADPFFNALYEKLGLPKEYLAGIDKDAFADDIVTVLLSTTRGLMALLSSRTAFKQESRLSSTLIQPKSNNPIKFSIDPVDTLEMLLLKKKKGYMSTEASYDEAMEDIQLHQMAFMSGLQATLEGVLKELDPDNIEQQVNKKGKTLMRLNANSQCWQLYKEKQQTLSKTVSENLNEVLGSYFSDAYQAQINSFKNGN